MAKGYLSRLLANDAVKRYLNQHQPEILAEFEVIVDTAAIDEAAAELLAEQEGDDYSNDDSNDDLEENTEQHGSAQIVPFVEAA